MFTIITESITPRIRYMARFLSDFFDIPFSVTDRAPGGRTYILNYTKKEIGASFRIFPHGLLSASGIQTITTDVKRDSGSGLPYFFETPKGNLPFDLLAFGFYLLSRYEEYSDVLRDRHGRFPAHASLAYKNHFLNIPILDRWLMIFKHKLFKHYEMAPSGTFSRDHGHIRITYDIDFPWAFSHRPYLANLAALFKDIYYKKYIHFKLRILNMHGLKKDPYDSYDLILSSLEQTKEQSMFFLMKGNSSYDRNHFISHPAFKQLIARMSKKINIGIHLSYNATDKGIDTMKAEKELLEKYAQGTITRNRSHYLKLRLPSTYRQLIRAGITEDYTMGYAEESGFRSGTSHSHYWYDLEKEQQSELRIIPLVFMDTSFIHHKKIPASEAKIILEQLIHEIQIHGGDSCILWHNNHLSPAIPEFLPWLDLYLWSLNYITQD